MFYKKQIKQRITTDFKVRLHDHLHGVLSADWVLCVKVAELMG